MQVTLGHTATALLPQLPSMPVKPATRQKKLLQATVNKVKVSGWRSINEFIEAYYNEPTCASQSLRYQPGTNFIPSRILDIWMIQVPSQAARDELNMTITRKAAEIMVKESTRAYHDPSLRLSSTGLDIPYLTTDFGLKKVQDTYFTLLPCLTFLLHALLTAENDYERWNGKEKVGKDLMASKVHLLQSSVEVTNLL